MMLIDENGDYAGGSVTERLRQSGGIKPLKIQTKHNFAPYTKSATEQSVVTGVRTGATNTDYLQQDSLYNDDAAQ